MSSGQVLIQGMIVVIVKHGDVMVVSVIQMALDY